jgi:CRP/FNR family transcriptional regulator, nitrogen fixation regulation protein
MPMSHATALNDASSFPAWHMHPLPRHGTDDDGAGNKFLHSFAQDSEIYAEGEEARSYYKVITGMVRCCKFSLDGRRQIDAFYVPGDVFGVEAGGEHRRSAEAVCDCTVISYRRKGLEALAATDERLAQWFFSYALRSLARAQDHSLVLGRRSAAQKLAAFLLEIAAHTPHGEAIELAMTRQDIADYLGLTIETVSRTLSQFERNAVIAIPSTRRIRLKDLASLRELNS